MGFSKRRAAGARGTDPERGASLVEFAVLAPLLVILVLGIVEFGWVFGQYNEVRHAAQEGARWGAVAGPDIDGGGLGNSDLIARVCDSASLAPSTSISIDADNGGGAKGATGTITVTATITSLTGAPLISSFLPSTLESEATFRLEQPATGVWGGIAAAPCP